MAIRMSTVVGCDVCEVEGIPDNTTIPKGWVNFSHRAVDGGVVTYYFCSYDCMISKVSDLIEIRKRKLRRQSGAALHAPIIFDDWPEEWAEKIEERARELAMEQQKRAITVGHPDGHFH